MLSKVTKHHSPVSSQSSLTHTFSF
jgi:hypothetical protein